eukprot:CAMPEP_0168392308 /NCGR_PEP_ID=MMETSP0228-20121227/18431_1 /TAXON_ID=133427 /ORGANISM="Protoceratium reticulatum, Strain CCCM 535 (=CCMP 1889)" /LENGTH=148 /DNA_ID=CAMNT_0008405645 /DNA_START=209 /DNA_END=652 /DNA_ORIENTATION=-
MIGGPVQERQFRKQAGLVTKVIPKIRWFCGLCQRQCKSQVGFTKHCKHPEHLQHELQAISRIQAGQARQHDLDAFSQQFKDAFVGIVTEKHPLVVYAHDVYKQMVPRDRAMKRMQETCWETLGSFCAHLRGEGRLRAWKTDRGWRLRL